jgi:hypothetical protein
VVVDGGDSSTPPRPQPAAEGQGEPEAASAKQAIQRSVGECSTRFCNRWPGLFRSVFVFWFGVEESAGQMLQDALWILFRCF